MSYGSESLPKEHKKTELYSSTHENLPRISIVSEGRGSKATNAVEMNNSKWHRRTWHLSHGRRMCHHGLFIDVRVVQFRVLVTVANVAHSMQIPAIQTCPMNPTATFHNIVVQPMCRLQMRASVKKKQHMKPMVRFEAFRFALAQVRMVRFARFTRSRTTA